MRDYKQTQRVIQDLLDDQIVPGVSYALIDGSEVYQTVKGDAQWWPEHEPLKPGMLYDLASLTKVVGTTTALLQLVEQGQLSVDDKLAQFVPGWHDKRISLRDLLTHTSAVAEYIPHRNELTASELKKAFLAKMHVEDSLNRQIKYADVNYLYLGWIIERIYDQPVQNVITEQVLKPLNLPTATFNPTPANCVPTEVQTKRGLIRGETHDPKGYILGESCGCAGLFASLKDLEIFSHALIENNLNGLLTSETIDLFFTDQTRIPGPHSRSLGWKLFHAKDHHLLISHTGFTGTWMVLDRQTDQGFIVLTNRVHPSAKNQEFLAARDQLFAIYLTEKEKTL